jgi:hypothetical protein
LEAREAKPACGVYGTKVQAGAQGKHVGATVYQSDKVDRDMSVVRNKAIVILMGL